MKHPLFTIGYEGVTVEAVIAAMKEAGVEILIDVRAVPLSRKPGFSKNKLAARLAEHEIRYIGLKGLGTPAEGRAAARKGNCAELRRIFTDYMESEAAQKDLTEAVRIAAAQKACLMCFEHAPDCCHRLMVSEDIVRQTGQETVHLDPYPFYLQNASA